MPPQKPKKQLVSKGRYASDLVGRIGAEIVGASLLFGCGGISFMIFLVAVRFAVLAFTQWEGLVASFASLIAAAFPALFAYWGYVLIKETHAREPLVPITRDAINQLPAAETLVRPSSAELIPEEQILLRATVATQETPANELLRPHNIERDEKEV